MRARECTDTAGAVGQPLLIFLQGDLLLRLGRPDGGARFLRLALAQYDRQVEETKSKDPNALYWRAAVHGLLGDLRSARRDVKRAKKLWKNPDYSSWDRVFGELGLI
jgi:hypothetical protein